MKKSAKLLSLLLSALMLFSLAACAEKDPKLEPADPGTVCYLSSDLVKRGLGSSYEIEKKEMTDIEETVKENPIHTTNELKYAYSVYKKESQAATDYGTHYSRYDIYNGFIIDIGYLHGTDKMCYYAESPCECDPDPITNRYTEEKAQEVVQAFLLKFAPQELLDEYQFSHMSLYHETSTLMCSLYYERYINGYLTDDTISVTIDHHGSVFSVRWENREKYDDLESVLTAENLTAVDQALAKKSAELGYDGIEPEKIITTDIYGRVYLEHRFFKRFDNGQTWENSIYMNVN